MHLTDEDEAEIRRFVENADLGGGYMPPQWEDQTFTDTTEETV